MRKEECDSERVWKFKSVKVCKNEFVEEWTCKSAKNIVLRCESVKVWYYTESVKFNFQTVCKCKSVKNLKSVKWEFVCDWDTGTVWQCDNVKVQFWIIIYQNNIWI